MIRKSKIEDAGIVTSLAIKLWNTHQFNELEKEIKELMQNDNAMIALVFDNITPAGFAQCSLRYDYVEGTKSSPVGYLEGIFVEENYRNQGKAKQLLNFCENWAKEKNCTEFASDCEIDNISSYKFHIAVGFIEVNKIICFKKEMGKNDK